MTEPYYVIIKKRPNSNLWQEWAVFEPERQLTQVYEYLLKQAEDWPTHEFKLLKRTDEEIYYVGRLAEALKVRKDGT